MSADEISLSESELVVLEDAAELRASTEAALHRQGYSCVSLYPAQLSYLSAHLQSGRPEPDLVVFGVRPESAESWQGLERVRSIYKGPVLVTVQGGDEQTRRRCAELGASDFLSWDQLGEEGLELKLEAILAVRRVEGQVAESDHRMQRLFLNIFMVILNMVESKDRYTRLHSHSVAAWSRTLGRRKGLSEEELLRLGLAGVFHDFGKIGIPEEILNKPARLTEEEFATIRHHPRIATDLLSSIELVADLLPAIAHHHERWDGQGYPDGLIGEQTPLWARIIGIADAYDTMIHARTYKAAMPLTQVMDEFRRNRGTQFDPELSDLMIEILEERRRSNGGLSGIPANT